MQGRIPRAVAWLTALVALVCAPAAGGAKKGLDGLRARPEAVEQWKDMRFGLFVCWGPVSLTGKEIGWSRGAPSGGRRPGMLGGRGPTPAAVYDGLYEKWKPDKFDARRWVQLAKDAGMKYVIFLVKHHDGFCLYDTRLTDYRSTAAASAWKVDVMKAVADACHQAGLKLMIYYSQPDWHHGDYLTKSHGRYVKYLHGQVRELLTNYGKIDGLWFDNLRGVSAETARLWDAEGLFRMARRIQPHLVINNRCGLPGDYDTPEQQIGRFQTRRPWESCITLGTQWSWKPNDRIKSLKECIGILVRCAAGDGNLALNTNPMPDGRIEPRQAERFRQIGRWMEKHGRSIYRTRGGPFVVPGRLGGSTHKGKTIYLHVLRWPGDTIALPPIPRKVVSHSVLTGGTASVEQTDEGIAVSVPARHRDELDTIVALELDGPAAGIEPRPLRSGSLAAGRKATASNVYRNSPQFSPDKAFDDDPATRWGCDWGTKSAWLAVDLGKPMTFDRASLSEPYGRVRKFELQAGRGDQWKTFHKGKTIGEDLSVTFPPVTARRVRLRLVETTEGPSIWEFQLFAPKR